MSVTLTTECVWRSSVYDRFSKKCNLLILRNIALLLVTLSDSVAEYMQHQKHRHIYLNMGPSCFEKESRVLYFYTNIHYESRSQECPLAYFQSWVAFCFGCFFFLFFVFQNNFCPVTGYQSSFPSDKHTFIMRQHFFNWLEECFKF